MSEQTMRLQKYLAHAGVASRRKCEELIAAGRVSINGATVTEQGIQVDVQNDEIRFDGELIRFEQTVCYLFYKPYQVMCTSSDPQGRAIVSDYFKEVPLRLYTVGRLDYDTEGLLLVTNDGELANQLTHPSHEIEKSYFVVCRGRLTREEAARLREGVMVDGRPTARAKVRIIQSGEANTRLYITIHEGRNRQVRKMLYAVGHDVTFLRRERLGDITLEGLQPGEWRPLTREELQSLHAAGRKGDRPHV